METVQADEVVHVGFVGRTYGSGVSLGPLGEEAKDERKPSAVCGMKMRSCHYSAVVCPASGELLT